MKEDYILDHNAKFLHNSFGITEDRSKELVNITFNLLVTNTQSSKVIEEIMKSKDFTSKEKILCIYGLNQIEEKLRLLILMKKLSEGFEK